MTAVAILLKIPGINIQVKKPDGTTARDLAQKAGHNEIVRLFDSFERDGQSALVFYENQQAKSEICDELLNLVNYVVEKKAGEKSWEIPAMIRRDIYEFVDSLTYKTILDLEICRAKLIQYRKELSGREFELWFHVLLSPVTFTTLIDSWLCATLETKYPEVQAVARCQLARCHFENAFFKENTERMHAWIAPLCSQYSPEKIDHPWQAYANFYRGIYCLMQSDTAKSRKNALPYFIPLTTYVHEDFDRKLQFAALYFVNISYMLAQNYDLIPQASQVAELQAFLKKALDNEDSPDFVKDDAQSRLRTLQHIIGKK